MIQNTETSLVIFASKSAKMSKSEALQNILQSKYPIIQAGMVWCSGWRLAAASCNAGAFGVIGAGSMYPHILEEHLTKMKLHTKTNFAVNLPLMYPSIEEHLELIIKHKVPVVITSAGSPTKFTGLLKDAGIKVMHLVSSVAHAQKAEQAGVDAVIAEGFEAGGHNGRDETTTFVLCPSVAEAVSIPLVAAGGIRDGRGIAAALALGADGVQIGSRFVLSEESSAHQAFKNLLRETSEGNTSLTLKELAPVRLIKNKFFEDIMNAYKQGADQNELRALLGKGRAKKGMFEGDLNDGELEIGQVAGYINEILPAAEIVNSLVSEFNETLDKLRNTDTW